MNINPNLQIGLNKASELWKKVSEVVSFKSVGYSAAAGFGVATAISVGTSGVLFSLQSEPNRMSRSNALDQTNLDQIVSLTDSDVKKVLKRNIFNKAGTLGGDLEAPQQNEEEKIVTDEIIKSNRPLKLWGTIYGGDPYTGIAMVQNTSRNITNSFMVGDRLVDNAVVMQILKEKIVFENSGQLEYIELEKKELVRRRGGKSASVKPSFSKPGRGSTISKGRLNKHKEEGFEYENGKAKISDTYKQNLITKDFSKVLQDAKAEPNMVDGQLQGFKLTRIREDSIYRKTGLANGDIVTEINGVELSSASQAIRTLQSLRSANQIEVTVIQEGVKRTLEISVGQ
jgi:general secretion pathway protein C